MVAFPSGMFACQTVDVSLFANPGARNALAVKVYPLDIPGDTRQWRTKGMMEYANGGDGLIGRNVTMLMSIGWDFTFRDGIRDRNTGIWKDMVFFATGDVRLDAPFVRTKLSDDLKSAELDISVEAINSNCDRWLFRGKAKGTLEIEVEGTPLRFTQDVTLHRGERRELHFKGTLANPRRAGASACARRTATSRGRTARASSGSTSGASSSAARTGSPRRCCGRTTRAWRRSCGSRASRA